jgi:hypothetical protein
MMNLLRARRGRSLVIAFSLVGLFLFAGCDSGGSSNSSGSGELKTSSPQRKKLQELKSKVKADADAAKK